MLARWLGNDHVQAWWRDPRASSTVQEKYGPRVRGEVPIEVFVASAEGVDVGIMQRYRIADHPETLASLDGTGFDASDAAGMDYLLGDGATVGRGVGTEMIRGFTDKLFAEFDDVANVAVTPQAANAASCRVLEKAGYERVWLGTLESDRPSDRGETALYVCSRRAWSSRRGR